MSAKEQEVFIGELPLMTPSGTFVNGVEVVVNQMHKVQEYSLTTIKGNTLKWKTLFNCRIIPGRGSWLDLNLTQKIFFISE